MSEVVFDCNGDDVLAIQVKEHFLQTGVINEPFQCAFCLIPVTPKAVRGDEFRVGPHFQIGDSDHSPDCPYGSLGEKRHNTKKSSSTRIYGTEVFLPGRLVPHRAPSTTVPGGATGVTDALGLASRIKIHGDLLSIENRSTTTLVATAVEAWLIARRLYYGEARDKRVREDHKFVSDKLRNHPLSLFGRELNYNSAFHKFVSEWKGAAIHYGKAAVERIGTADYILRSVDTIKNSDTAFDGFVRLQTSAMASNLMTKKLVESLDTHNAAGTTVQWFGYGAMVQNGPGTSWTFDIVESPLIYLKGE